MTRGLRASAETIESDEVPSVDRYPPYFRVDTPYFRILTS